MKGERQQIAPARLISYPLVLRTDDFAWWKPLCGVVLLLVAVLVVVPIVLVPVLAVSVVLLGGPGSFSDKLTDAMQADQVTPSSMLYINLTLASLTIVTMLIVRRVHGISPRWLASVLPGIRWRYFFTCLGVAVIAVALALAAQALVPGDLAGDSSSAAFPTGQLFGIAIVILLTTPLQALGEEYAFRGYLLQAFGSLFLSRTAAVGISSLLFALAHGVQNAPLFFDRLAFGLMAGLAVVLVGGLEAGIALHVVNNIAAFGIAIAYNDVGSALNVTEVSWWQVPQTVVQNGVFLLLVLWIARRMKLSNQASRSPGAQP